MQYICHLHIKNYFFVYIYSIIGKIRQFVLYIDDFEDAYYIRDDITAATPASRAIITTSPLTISDLDCWVVP